MILIANGWIEIYTEFEGNEFIIETQTTGTIINPRLFVVEDMIHINIRSMTHCKLFHLKTEVFNFVKNNDEDILDKVSRF